MRILFDMRTGMYHGRGVYCLTLIDTGDGGPRIVNS